MGRGAWWLPFIIMRALSIFIAVVFGMVSVLVPVQEARASVASWVAGLLYGGTAPSAGAALAVALMLGTAAYVGAKYQPISGLWRWCRDLYSRVTTWWNSLTTAQKDAWNQAAAQYQATGSVTLTDVMVSTLDSWTEKGAVSFPIWGDVTGITKTSSAYEISIGYPTALDMWNKALIRVTLPTGVQIAYLITKLVDVFSGYREFRIEYRIYEIKGSQFKELTTSAGYGDVYEIQTSDYPVQGLSVTFLDGTTGTVPYIRVFQKPMAWRSDYVAGSVTAVLEKIVSLVKGYGWPSGTLVETPTSRDSARFDPVFYPGQTITSNIPIGSDGSVSIPTDVTVTGADAIGLPAPAPSSGAEVGLLEDIKNILSGLAVAIAKAISDIFVGDWSQVSLAPLESAFQTVSEKFPFSLPWDVGRLAGVFDVPATDVAPSWSLVMPAFLGGGSMDIVLPAEFVDIWKFVRWAMVIMWDIGLVSWASGWFKAGSD